MISATTMSLSGPNNSKSANVVFDNGSKMISLNIDNSCGAMTSMARADIRLLFTNPLSGGIEDVTTTVFGGSIDDTVTGSIKNMATAMKWLQRTDWGMDAQMISAG